MNIYMQIYIYLYTVVHSYILVTVVACTAGNAWMPACGRALGVYGIPVQILSAWAEIEIVREVYSY